MALTGKNLPGESKIEKENFSIASFTDAEAQVFDSTKVIELMKKISSDLLKIEEDYEKIRKGYGNCLDDTVSGKKMSSDNEDGKKIRKFKKKADDRADYVAKRRSSLESQISSLETTLEMINAENAKREDEADSDNIANND